MSADRDDSMKLERPAELSCFALTLGQVMGAMSREDIQEWLRANGVTVEEIAEFKQSSCKIASAFYYRVLE